MKVLKHRNRREFEPLLGEMVKPGEKRGFEARQAQALLASGRWSEPGAAVDTGRQTAVPVTYPAPRKSRRR